MTLTISCDECAMQRTSVCRDCVVTVLCDPRRTDAVIIDADEERAVRMLARAGLIPGLQHRPRAICG